MSEDELLKLLPLINAGKVVVMKAGPWKCLCGAVIDTVRFLAADEAKARSGATTEKTCSKCGEKWYG